MFLKWWVVGLLSLSVGSYIFGNICDHIKLRDWVKLFPSVVISLPFISVIGYLTRPNGDVDLIIPHNDFISGVCFMIGSYLIMNEIIDKYKTRFSYSLIIYIVITQIILGYYLTDFDYSIFKPNL